MWIPCLELMNDWMWTNKLKLNPDNTAVILVRIPCWVGAGVLTLGRVATFLRTGFTVGVLLGQVACIVTLKPCLVSHRPTLLADRDPILLIWL